MSTVPHWQPGTPGVVPSPCNNVCRINVSSGYCEGCWRTIDEIAHWARLDDEAKRDVWRELQRREEGAAP